jgi:hypothetical protein
MSAAAVGTEPEEAATLSAVGSRSSDVGPPPAALARLADHERRRELARALHESGPPRSRGIAERLDQMRTQLAQYRAAAIALHARLVELESAGNDNIAALRRQLIASSVQIEGVGRSIVGSPEPTRWPRGTEQIEDWPDEPTLRRR